MPRARPQPLPTSDDDNRFDDLDATTVGLSNVGESDDDNGSDSEDDNSTVSDDGQRADWSDATSYMDVLRKNIAYTSGEQDSSAYSSGPAPEELIAVGPALNELQRRGLLIYAGQAFKQGKWKAAKKQWIENQQTGVLEYLCPNTPPFIRFLEAIRNLGEGAKYLMVKLPLDDATDLGDEFQAYTNWPLDEEQVLTRERQATSKKLLANAPWSNKHVIVVDEDENGQLEYISPFVETDVDTVLEPLRLWSVTVAADVGGLPDQLLALAEEAHLFEML